MSGTVVEMYEELAVRVVWLFLVGGGVALGLMLVGLGWVWGYLTRCRHERETDQVSEQWRAEQLRREAEGGTDGEGAA